MSPAPRSRLHDPRSLLCERADRPCCIDATLPSRADAVIVDLEEAIRPERRDAARATTFTNTSPACASTFSEVPLEGFKPRHSLAAAGNRAKKTGNSTFLSDHSAAGSVSFAHSCGQMAGKRCALNGIFMIHIDIDAVFHVSIEPASIMPRKTWR